MLKLLGLILCSLFINPAWANCDTETFIFIYKNSIFESEDLVNVPLEIDGKSACYKQSKGLKISAEKMTKSESLEYEISPLKVEFKNVPSPEVYQYIFLENESADSTKISLMSFVCSGETPIGGDALSASLSRFVEDKGEDENNINIFISTGRAAENIGVSQEKKAKAKVYDRFLELYESRTAEEFDERNSSNIYIPNILSGISSETSSEINRKLYSAFFSKTGSSINGCSKQFLKNMNDLLIEKVVKAQPFKNIEIKRKRFTSKIKLKWLK
jgi:hypothetical protein